MAEYTIAEIAEAIGAVAVGNAALRVRGTAEPASAGPDELALATNPKYAAKLAKGQARAALLWAEADIAELGLEAGILAARGRFAMAGVAKAFEDLPEVEPGIHPTAVVSAEAHIGADARIGPFVVVGAGARIGARARIGAHVSIADGATLGDDAILHAGVRIAARVRIGDRFRSHSNTVIGADGFSFVTPEPDAVEQVRKTFGNAAGARQSAYARIASLGSVEIGDDVEMGAGCTIDRGTVADTVICRGAKLDNMVHVGHNVHVGEDTLLCGQVGIAGSAFIGDRVVLAGQCGVADHTRVGHDVIAGGATKIYANVPDGRVILGSPAMKMEQNVEIYKALRRLPKLVARVTELERRVPRDGESE